MCSTCVHVDSEAIIQTLQSQYESGTHLGNSRIKQVVTIDNFLMEFHKAWSLELKASEMMFLELFARFDVDGGGTLDMQEFKRLLVASGTVENLPSDDRYSTAPCTVHCTLYPLYTVPTIHCTHHTLYTVPTIHRTHHTLYTVPTIHRTHYALYSL
jgi:hypothetical protein